jgi:hypothetical protein
MSFGRVSDDARSVVEAMGISESAVVEAQEDIVLQHRMTPESWREQLDCAPDERRVAKGADPSRNFFLRQQAETS